jgi:hypothetical protein
MERRQIELGLAEILATVRQSERQRGPRRSRTLPKAEARQRTSRPGRRERAVKRGGKGRK